MIDLMRLSKYFQTTHDVCQVQKYIKSLIDKQRINIEQRFSSLDLLLFLYNKDIISIALNKKLTPYNQNYIKINNNCQNQIVVPNNQFDLMNKNADAFKNKNEEIRNCIY